MTNLLTKEEAHAYANADVDSLIPAGMHKVLLTTIEPRDDRPEVKCFKFKVLSDAYRGRVLRAWPSTHPDMIWTLRRLIGDVVVDPTTVQLEDLEDHVFSAKVTIEQRRDNGEPANRIERLLPWSEPFADQAADNGGPGDDWD